MPAAMGGRPRATPCGFRRSVRAAPRAAPRRRARNRPCGSRARRLISATAVAPAPDQVGIETDDRIAAAHVAALDRFQQKAMGRPAASLRKAETGVSRSATRVVQTAWARRVHRSGERARLRLDLHSENSEIDVGVVAGGIAVAGHRLAYRLRLMVTPISCSSRAMYWQKTSSDSARLRFCEMLLASAELMSVFGTTISVTRNTT